MNFNMIMEYGNGSSVRGTPGLMYPTDKAKLDYLMNWTATHTVTVDGLSDLRTAIEALSTRLDALEGADNVITPAELDLLNSAQSL